MRLDLLPAPVVAACGTSGSGKTTLLEAVIARLVCRGLKVAVVKHDAHGVQVDREGKDSDRLFRAGASVVLQAPEESFARFPSGADTSLNRALATLAFSHDLVLVEGHKDSPLPKVWLTDRRGSPPPSQLQQLLATLPWDGERLAFFLQLTEECLRRHFETRPLLGGVLVGGSSSRMGRPKHLAQVGGRTLLERVGSAVGAHTHQVVLLGQAQKTAGRPCLPDAPGVSGPLAGVLSALRWHPTAAWLIAACDMPALDADALGWVLEQRHPGIWAVIPAHQDGHLEPLAAVWEPQAIPILEDLVLGGEPAPRLAARHPKVVTPTLPAHLSPRFCNVNTPADLAALRRPHRSSGGQPSGHSRQGKQSSG